PRRHAIHLHASTLSAHDPPSGPYKLPTQGMVAEAIERRRPALREDVSRGADKAADALDAALRQGEMRALACLPMVARGVVLGTPVLGSRRAGSYRAAELPLLQQLAGQLALALERARMETLGQKRAAKLALLADIGRQIVAPIDVETLLGRVVRGL